MLSVREIGYGALIQRDAEMKVLLTAIVMIATMVVSTGAFGNEVENVVRQEFGKYPVLIRIAKCESQFRQWRPDGEVLRNPSGATGVMQIMPQYHKKSAQKMGMDIETLHGNLRYARHLHKTQGTRPWNASKHCWG